MFRFWWEWEAGGCGSKEKTEAGTMLSQCYQATSKVFSGLVKEAEYNAVKC